MGKAYIVFENGQKFEGESFGAEGEATGELVFTTGMGGYVETLTDPNYYGQIILQTFPEIGDYGIISAEFESPRCAAKGYVVRGKCDRPSNHRAETTVDEFLKSQGVVGIYGVDTRAITKMIRENGVMNAKITPNPDNASIDEIKAYKITDPVGAVSTKKRADYFPEKKKCSVALIDYGVKKSIINNLVKQGCEVWVLPRDTKAAEILSLGADGVVLSNGPGDPADNAGCIREIRAMLGKIPIFGIGLGHQMLALAAGGSTAKLKYGHRGANQPVKDLKIGRVYITGQNHGYTVLPEGLDEFRAQIRFINMNDNTIEGIEYLGINAFSLQFFPEDFAWEWDGVFSFDRFLNGWRGRENAE
jgi:carbamoyl-phosphate synthase small subunit